MTSKAGFRSRKAALYQLAEVLDKGKNLADTDSGMAADTSDHRDAAFARHLAYGVLRWYSALDYLSSRLMQKPLKKRDQDIHRLILIGLFQLWKDDTAEYAAINETAECARVLRKTWGVGLINAVLRRFQREREQHLQALRNDLARFAHPIWLLEQIQTQWPDEEIWQQIVMQNNLPAPMWLRLNARSDTAETEKKLKDSGFEILGHAVLSDARRIEPAASVEDVPGFSEGRLSVQDPAAQLATELLQLENGQRLLDACCAPGGKTCHVLERSSAIRLTALDRSQSRLGRVQESLRRLGLGDRGAELICADAGDPDSWWDGQAFQRILLDAPCTATGVIRRHPEIKWLRSPDQVEHSRATQQRLLEQLWPCLEPGGKLLYATCSILKTENEQQIAKFLAEHSDARLDIIDASWGRDTGSGRQILPGDDGMDGFFYARLQKIE